MIREELAEILHKTLGLNISSIGANTLERSINRRLKKLDLANQTEYVLYLRKRRSEIHQLIDEVVISETWFFRDTALFEALREIAGLWYQKPRSDKIRILSIPCASGEEPYSIAMTLLEAGWPKSAFQLDAVDISARIIERAKRATYTKNSFRSVDLSFRDRYFGKKGNSYVLKKEISRLVHFHCGNILDPTFMAGLGLFDIIFCRNILIYLEIESQQQTVRELAKLLRPEGVLFVGAAEATLYLSEAFVPFDHRYGNVMVRRPSDKAAREMIKQKCKKVRSNEGIASIVESAAFANPARRDKSCQDTASMLLAARKLADNGKLQQAEEICLDILKTCGPIAEAYYLLGILYDAQGQLSESAKLLKKALYLLPDHEESLVLLCYISERLGDAKAVANYKRRLQRLEKKRTDHDPVA